MARAYSDELRRKLLEAHEEKAGSLTALAARFRVSVSWAKTIPATKRRTGRMEKPAAGPRGPRSRLTPEVREPLRGWIGKQPDLTLMEVRQRLSAELQLTVSMGRLWKVFQEMGLRLKNSHSMPPGKTPKPGV